MVSIHPSHIAESRVTQQVVTNGSVETPLGAFEAVFTELGLVQLSFPSGDFSQSQPRESEAASVGDLARLKDLSEQLGAYFLGSLRSFSIPLDLRGTPFQLKVWNALLEIGYGEVRSYADIARAVGRPAAVRAVGAANGANPVPIVVPCHRVVGSNGGLTGYGGGLDLKNYLLRLEGVKQFGDRLNQPALFAWAGSLSTTPS